MIGKRIGTWLLFLCWAVFVNACNVWLIRPLAADFALLGILGIAAIVLLWLTSIPSSQRRRWVGFTIFSLLLGDGLSEMMSRPLLTKICLGLVMIVGLSVLAWVFARLRWRYLSGTAVILAISNLWLPFDQWPLLTHFSIAYHARVLMQSSDLPALPLQPIQTASGTAVVTLQNILETEQQVQNTAQTATDSPDALENVLRNAHHRYEFMALVQSGGRFHLTQLPLQDLSAVNPHAFTAPFFPFIRAYWTLDNGRVVQYMAPAQPPSSMVDVANQPGYSPAMLQGLAEATDQAEMNDWHTLLSTAHVAEDAAGWKVANGRLTGTWNGRAVSIPVNADTVVGEGSFTAPHVHEVLLEGANTLEVVSLDDNRIVSRFSGDPLHPLSSDIVIGPLDNSGRDAIFVNAAPAEILQAEPDQAWKVLYTAPNTSLRFEASVRFAGDATPELITNDPSYLRNSPVRYLSSYTYRDGQLVRNWRVFQTNLVNVHAVQFSQDEPPYLVTSTYGSGQLYVLKRHDIPVVPITSALLAASVVIGWLIKWRGRRNRLA
ncbi:hypothetical protein GCM10025857_04220 [Alicyclobacillus contaminans]|uniref:hypothetical protein n=1 Tax=Alicyclobacillus contaminans TaxID=392016 RepID=UPI00041A78BB|nr:hypothetical protein [Alicyclobacillus contaminans]GMA49065.1 hypothetical protein GCM10025857_04220 [Alicyclobacillus contaminans]